MIEEELNTKENEILFNRFIENIIMKIYLVI